MKDAGAWLRLVGLLFAAKALYDFSLMFERRVSLDRQIVAGMSDIALVYLTYVAMRAAEYCERLSADVFRLEGEISRLRKDLAG